MGPRRVKNKQAQPDAAGAAPLPVAELAQHGNGVNSSLYADLQSSMSRIRAHPLFSGISQEQPHGIGTSNIVPCLLKDLGIGGQYMFMI